MYRPQKKAVNLSISKALLDQCRAIGIKNLSKLVEEYLKTKLKAMEIAKWHKENEKGLKEYHERITKNGVFGDTFGRFSGEK